MIFILFRASLPNTESIELCIQTFEYTLRRNHSDPLYLYGECPEKSLSGGFLYMKILCF